METLHDVLTAASCEAYERKFNENGITIDLFSHIDRSILRELGVSCVGDRIRLLLAAARFREQEVRRITSSRSRFLSRSDQPNKLHNYEPNLTHGFIRSQNATITPLGRTSVMSMDQVRQNTIRVILEAGQIRNVNVANTFNGDSIKRAVLDKLGIKGKPDDYCFYLLPAGSSRPRVVSGIELVTICHSADRKERSRLIFCRSDRQPTPAALEASRRVEPQTQPSGTASRSSHDGLRSFYGQRPPSELISSNLAEYFPEVEGRKLRETIRNSVRYSMGMSRMHRPPPALAESRSLLGSESNTIGEYILPKAAELAEAMPEEKDAASGDVSGSRRSALRASVLRRLSRGPNAHLSVVSASPAGTDSIQLFEEEELSDEELLKGDLWEDLQGPKKWIKGAFIGSGSFSQVFLGMNALTGELMAVKCVELPGDGNEHARQRKESMIQALQREMDILKDLHHDNIVRYLGSSTDETHLNIFLEYVPGGSVASMLTNYGPFEEPLIRNFVRQILLGLNYLHERDILHRDIKGANVLINIQGGVKITDFGISKKMTSESLKSGRRASLHGSVFWMAPEVIKQTVYTLKADIWSVGCLIVEMFTGKHPFPNYSQMQAIFRIGTSSATPEIPAQATEACREFLARTFVIDFRNRATAQELLAHPFLDTLIMSRKQ